MSMNIQIKGINSEGNETVLNTVQTRTEETYFILEETTWQKRKERYFKCLDDRFHPDKKEYNLNNPFEKKVYEDELSHLEDIKSFFNEFERLSFQMM